MYTKKIKCQDFNGNEYEREYFFNLTEAELIEMNLSKEGGLEAYVNRIMNARNTPELTDLFKAMILKSYGEVSDDGTRFIKKDPVRGRLADEFEQTNAYSALFMELATNTDEAIKFFNGIVPQNVALSAADMASAGITMKDPKGSDGNA